MGSRAKMCSPGPLNDLDIEATSPPIFPYSEGLPFDEVLQIIVDNISQIPFILDHSTSWGEVPFYSIVTDFLEPRLVVTI